MMSQDFLMFSDPIDPMGLQDDTAHSSERRRRDLIPIIRSRQVPGEH